jgi:hypothetical protein
MSGIPVDTRFGAFQIMQQNLITYPPSFHVETQAKTDEFVSEQFADNILSGCQTSWLGPLYAIAARDQGHYAQQAHAL